MTGCTLCDAVIPGQTLSKRRSQAIDWQNYVIQLRWLISWGRRGEWPPFGDASNILNDQNLRRRLHQTRPAKRDTSQSQLWPCEPPERMRAAGRGILLSCRRASLDKQRLSHFFAISPQLICDRIASRSTHIKRASVVSRYVTELATFRPPAEVPVGLLYDLVDEGADFGREFGLLALKIHMGVVDCLIGVRPVRLPSEADAAVAYPASGPAAPPMTVTPARPPVKSTSLGATAIPGHATSPK